VTSVILDASAILALLLGEKGSEIVQTHLVGASVSALNYSEILTRLSRLCGSLDEAKRRVDRHDFAIVAFDAEQATLAASLVPATRQFGISLADRACLSLGLSRGLPVLTGNRMWGQLEIGVRILQIR
jgi:ribonuclease VapC